MSSLPTSSLPSGETLDPVLSGSAPVLSGSAPVITGAEAHFRPQSLEGLPHEAYSMTERAHVRRNEMGVAHVLGNEMGMAHDGMENFQNFRMTGGMYMGEGHGSYGPHMQGPPGYYYSYGSGYQEDSNRDYFNGVDEVFLLSYLRLASHFAFHSTLSPLSIFLSRSKK